MVNPPGRLALSLMLLIAGLLLIPAVSAEEVLNEHIDFYVDTSESVTYGHGSVEGSGLINLVRFNRIENHPQVNYVIFNGKEMPYKNAPNEGRYEITYTLGGVTKPAVMHISASRNLLGSITSFRYIVFFEDWYIGDLTGVQDVTLSKSLGFYKLRPGTPSGWGGFIMKYAPGASGVYYYAPPNIEHDVIISSQNAFENQLVVDLENGLYNVQIFRYLSGNYYASTIDVSNNDTIVYTNSESIDKSVFFDEGEINKIDLTSPDGNIYTFPLTGSGGEEANGIVNVYVKNSQTGALLADARLTIQDTTTDPWTEVVNETLSSGQGSFSLPKDTGIHLTQYRIGATVPGYQQVVPALFARVTGPTNIVVEMEPLAGGPADPDNTYLEFYVRDLNANGIPNANVLVDGKTRWTNGQGYTQFEVVKNSTYPYTVSKSGYMTIQGSAIVADGPRYVANVVLGPGTVPAHTPTLAPGETPTAPGATPTPDHRTNEQKGQAIIDLIADFAEPIAILAILATIFGLMKMMTPGRR